jgi:hypothetical protein
MAKMRQSKKRLNSATANSLAIAARQISHKTRFYQYSDALQFVKKPKNPFEMNGKKG